MEVVVLIIDVVVLSDVAVGVVLIGVGVVSVLEMTDNWHGGGTSIMCSSGTSASGVEFE